MLIGLARLHRASRLVKMNSAATGVLMQESQRFTTSGSQPDHFQQPPYYSSPWMADKALRQLVKRLLPNEAFEKVDADLSRFGDRVAGKPPLPLWG
jgi:hypothetical protein